MPSDASPALEAAQAASAASAPPANSGINSPVAAPSNRFRLIREEVDELGMSHRRYQQLLNGLPIEGAIAIEHRHQGDLRSVSGEWVHAAPANLPELPAINEGRALNRALASVGAQLYKWQRPEEELHLKLETGNPEASYRPRGSLVYFAGTSGLNNAPPKLAFRFDIYAEEPLSRQLVYVDAISGRILGSLSLLQEIDSTGTAYTGYSGQQTITTDQLNPTSFRLRSTNGTGKAIQTFNLKTKTTYNLATDFSNGSNIWGKNDSYTLSNNKDAYALDAHFGAEKTYDFFKTVFGRNSIDNNGLPLKSYVHYSRNYFNAFWDGYRMTYGDGSSTNNYLPLTSLDVCGHEITHGLTTYSANLNYSGESGALNEGFSDIFGTTIEAYARGRTAIGSNSDKWDWSLGADFKYVIRDMVNPKSYGDPDTYQGSNWYTGTGDNGGVHTNSGVLNYWFALLCEGSGAQGVEHAGLNIDGDLDTNDKGYKFEVKGLGLDKAQAIAYRTLTRYLTPTSNYQAARQWSIQAAVDLVSGNRLTPEEAGEVAYAWNAVGVGGGTSADAQRLFAGGAASDTLYGGHLDDVLIGRGGNDIMWGNSGADIFALVEGSSPFYSGPNEMATIKDFSASDGDSLRLMSGSAYSYTTDNLDTLLYSGSTGADGDLLAVLTGADLGAGTFSSAADAPAWVQWA